MPLKTGNVFAPANSTFSQPPLPTDNLPNRIDNNKLSTDQLEQRIRTLENLLVGFKRNYIQAYDQNGLPKQYFLLFQEAGTGTFVASGATLWAFKIYDTSLGSSASITINGTGNPTSVSDTVTPGINGTNCSNANTIIPVSGTGFVWIALALTAGSNTPNTVTVQVGSSVPNDVIDSTTGTPTSAYRQIGTYNVTITNGIAKANITNSNPQGYQGFSYCAFSQWW